MQVSKYANDEQSAESRESKERALAGMMPQEGEK